MEQTSTLAPRRAMRADDWFHSVINLLIGALLGSAATGLAQLLLSGALVMAMIMTVFAVTMFLIVLASDKLLDRLFTIGIRPANYPGPIARKPLPRVLSFPAGFLLGIALALLGIDVTLPFGTV